MEGILKGKLSTIRHCENFVPMKDEPKLRELLNVPEDADIFMPPSLIEALKSFKRGQIRTALAGMKERQQRLVDFGQLRSPEHMNKEGNLDKNNHFYAIKAGKLRAYCWLSKTFSGTYFISHYAFKKGQKLSKENTGIVKSNWKNTEKT